MSKDNSTPGQNDLGHINRVTQDMIDTRSSGLFKVTQFPKGTPRSAVAPWFTKCDGGPIARFMQDGTTKSYFFETYGVTYGAGDGSTTVQVPNYTESATLDNYIQTAPIGCDAAGNKVYGYYTQNELDKLGVSVYGKTYIDAKDKALEDYMLKNFKYADSVSMGVECIRIHNSGKVRNGTWYKTGFFPYTTYSGDTVGGVNISTHTHTDVHNTMYAQFHIPGIIARSDGVVSVDNIRVIALGGTNTSSAEVEFSIIKGELCVRNSMSTILTVDVDGYNYYSSEDELVKDYDCDLVIRQTDQIESLSSIYQHSIRGESLGGYTYQIIDNSCLITFYGEKITSDDILLDIELPIGYTFDSVVGNVSIMHILGDDYKVSGFSHVTGRVSIQSNGVGKYMGHVLAKLK